MDWASLQPDVVLRILLALALGAVIGLEREIHGRPAGLRTHILVCLAATMMMVAAEDMAGMNRSNTGVVRFAVDPGRVAAGIVTGIGFLGAGAILRAGDVVRGITTAGCIWFVAGLGIAIGEGLYLLATMCTALALAVLTCLDVLERRITGVVYRSVSVVIPTDKAEATSARCREVFGARGIRVQGVSQRASRETQRAEITFHVRAQHPMLATDVIGDLMKIPEVAEASWL